MTNAYTAACDVDEQVFFAQAFTRSIYLLLEENNRDFANVLLYCLEDALKKADESNKIAIAHICKLEQAANPQLAADLDNGKE